jgi:hypothetical protein
MKRSTLGLSLFAILGFLIVLLAIFGGQLEGFVGKNANCLLTGMDLTKNKCDSGLVCDKKLVSKNLAAQGRGKCRDK